VTSIRTTHRPLTVVGVLLAMFMAAMEATVVGTAMPTVVEKLGGIEYYGWVTAVYLLAATVTMPLYGKLSDLYGRKPIMLAGMAIFLAGSMASGLSRSMVQLIAFRSVQGIGAGGLQPVAITVIGDIFKPAERARIQGIFGAVWGLAAMSGPLLGGLIVHALSWRWVFYINVPFGAVSAAMLMAFFHEPIVKKDHTLDAAGTVLLAAGIVALLLGASRFAPPVMLPLAAVLLGVFVWVERRAAEPVLSLALLQRRVMAVSSVAGALVGSVMSSTVTYLPLYVQAVLAGSPTQAGGTVAPMLIGWPAASALGGRLLPRTGYRPLVRVGFVVVAVASLALALLLRRAAPPWALGTAMFAMGTGMGLANTSLLIAVQESASWAERGVATASTMFFRSIGGAVAVGALGTVLSAGMGDNVDARLLNQLLGPEHGRSLGADVLAQLSDHLQRGLWQVFDVIAAMSVAALCAGFLFPRRRLAQASATVVPAGAGE
jgi:EmrB/QacA subfamily drug resistance transporter